MMLELLPEYRKQAGFAVLLISSGISFIATPALMGLTSFLIRQVSTTLFNIAPTALRDNQIYEFFYVGTLSYMASWVGFLVLVPTYIVLKSIRLDGFLPCVLAGAVIGFLAPTIVTALLDAGPFLDLETVIVLGSYGAFHAAIFWLAVLYWTKP